MARLSLPGTGRADDFEGRRQMRAIASEVADLTGRDMRDVLRLCVETRSRELCADQPGALAGCVQFEMAMHDHEMAREVARKLMHILQEAERALEANHDAQSLAERFEAGRAVVRACLREHGAEEIEL